MKSIQVSADHVYQVFVGRNILSEISNHLDGATRVAIIHPQSMRASAGSLRQTFPNLESIAIEIPDAESAKAASVLEFCWMALGKAGFTRNDVIVSLGGGATTDLAGFVAATWLRGIRIIHVPTTLLAMVDAAVGGKTGINTSEGKNLVGAIYSPVAVICDLNFLGSQSREDYIGGLAEIIKCGFIRDETILSLIESDMVSAQSSSWIYAPEVISRAIQVKADVVGVDLRETLGTAIGREILNYGHTFGHAVERIEHYSWRHGNAVSVGMMFVANLAQLAGILDQDVVDRHRAVLSGVGLPVTYNRGTFNQLHDAMRIDKKARGSQLRFIVLNRVGSPQILEGPDSALLIAAYGKLGQAEVHA
jgi:3-dehydroquinate synthase